MPLHHHAPGGLCLTKVFHLSPDLAVGMVLLLLPQRHGLQCDELPGQRGCALAVSVTTVSTLLAPVMMPFLVWARPVNM